MMRVALDVQTMHAHKDGIGFYLTNLIEALTGLSADLEIERLRPTLKKDQPRAPQRFWWEQVAFPLAARKRRADIIHQPGGSVPIMFTGKKVVTVHDLIPSLLGADFPFVARQYFGRFQPATYRCADRVITISDYTKRDLMRLVGMPEEKIRVIYLAADPHGGVVTTKTERQKTLDRLGIRAPYFLHVGTISPRKNVEIVVKALQLLIRMHPSIQFIVAGRLGWGYAPLLASIKDLGLEKHVQFLGYVTDYDRAILLTGAAALVFPSKYEGFGLPALEAMAAGTPVIAANVASLPEIIGEAGLLVDPADAAGWANAMAAVLCKPKLTSALREKGLQRNRDFTWEKTARQTLAVYHELMEQR